MADCPDYYTNISLILSRVMNDVDVNEESVLKRRRANLVAENSKTLCQTINNAYVTSYIFGSQTEGTTTVGLDSDTDVLNSHEYVNLIQDWKHWEHGKINLMMLRDERLYPGHCKLQMIYRNVPLPVRENDCPDDGNYGVDDDGTVIYRTFLNNYPIIKRHGPAHILQDGQVEMDVVLALRCQTWPHHYKQWTLTDKRKDWPTPEMIRHMKSTGCFVVKAAHRLDEHDDTWIISTSLAERCLMFSLNITQIRCYILLKMIVKTFIQPYLPDTISSYMCKTLLFHATENTSTEFWKEHNLLQCVHQVLLYMIAAVLDENCPNYFNEQANLFIGKVGQWNKTVILPLLRNVLKSQGRFLLEMSCDSINSRLGAYIGACGRSYMVSQEDMNAFEINQCRGTIGSFYDEISVCVQFICLHMHKTNINETINRINLCIERGKLQKEAAVLFLPFICSFLASICVSRSILEKVEAKPSTLKLFDLSLSSDVSSSRLKFASYLYCTGQLQRALSVLRDVEERMTDDVMMACGSHVTKYPPLFLKRETRQKYTSTSRLAVCVMFSMAELQCCPRELQCEIFRSTREEKINRTVGDEWMDLVVMDSLPYMYYLQYMTYRHLGKHDRQFAALNKLIDCARNNGYLTHRETAYNVLGQCMEYEGWLEDAFEYYKLSLKIRQTNNIGRWHIMRLKSRLARQNKTGLGVAGRQNSTV